MVEKIPFGRKFNRRAVVKAGAAGLALGGFTSANATADSQTEWRGVEFAARDGRYNVGCTNGTGVERAKEVATSVHRQIDALHTVSIEADPAEIQDLFEFEEVRYVEPDRTYQLDLPAQDTAIQQAAGSDDQEVPWGVERISAVDAHRKRVRGDTAHVAVLDTGIDATHEDLRANLGDGIGIQPCEGDLVPWECNAEWDDDHGHGTHVAGTIAAADNDRGVVGVGPKITLHAVKILDQDGAGLASDIAAGLVWTAANGYDVANMSLGDGYSQVIQDAIEFASDRGVLLVAAAGNDAAPVSYPAFADEVIAVSATTPDDELAWFSNRGPEVELAAPGVDVLSTVPRGDGYTEASGTSMASPHVAGTAGLLMAHGYSAATTRKFMRKTAMDLGLPSEYQGSGLVNASAVARKWKRKKTWKWKRSRGKKHKPRGWRHATPLA